MATQSSGVYEQPPYLTGHWNLQAYKEVKGLYLSIVVAERCVLLLQALNSL